MRGLLNMHRPLETDGAFEQLLELEKFTYNVLFVVILLIQNNAAGFTVMKNNLTCRF